jgi:hypothetical protein
VPLDPAFKGGACGALADQTGPDTLKGKAMTLNDVEKKIRKFLLERRGLDGEQKRIAKKVGRIGTERRGMFFHVTQRRHQ